MRRAAVAVVVVACALLAPGQAGADEPRPGSERGGPGAEQIQFAAHEHDLGYRAYVGKQFDEAATHFENAFFAAPNPAELRNAIRARREGRQLARAATLAAIGQRKFPEDAATAKLAEVTIAEARPSVFELQIESEEGFSVAIDDKIVTVEKFKSFNIFTAPGRHDLLVSWSDDRTKRTSVDAKAGATQSLLFEAPPAPAQPPAAAPPASPVQTPPPATSQPPRPTPPPVVAPGPPPKPIAPAVFIALAGLTVVGAGVTTWSGFDAQSNPGQAAVRTACVGLTESCPTYQQGLRAQLRTNVLLAVTGAVGLSAAAIAVFFTDWSGLESAPKAAAGPRVAPFVGPGAAGLLGTF